VVFVPIELALRPLLEVMRAEAGGKGRVIASMPPDEDWAETFRRHLQRAGITGPELFADTATHKQVRLYDLHATGITWRCLRQDYGPEIQKASHEKYDTTDGYIRMAGVFIGRVGFRSRWWPRLVVASGRHRHSPPRVSPRRAASCPREPRSVVTWRGHQPRVRVRP
jgi:hypothetical protein